MTAPKIGRKKPYTQIGIRRVPCSRCGSPSTQQWSVCSLDNRYLGVCDDCDLMLNRVVLFFMRIPGRATLMARYRWRMRRERAS